VSKRFATPSSVIGLVLIVQTFVVLRPTGPAAWPFTEYPMYSDVHFEGDVVHRRLLFAVLEDKRTTFVHARDFRLTMWAFQSGPLAAVVGGDIDRARVFANALAISHGRVTAFRLIDRARVLTPSGTEDRSAVTELPLPDQQDLSQ